MWQRSATDAEHMRRNAILILLLLYATSTMAHTHKHTDTLGVGGHVSFVENRGQLDSAVLYEAQMGRAALFLEREAFTIALRQVVQQEPDKPFHHSIYGRKGHAYKIRFAGCNHSAKVEGVGRFSTYNNYFRGRDRSRWRSHVPEFASVVYHDLWQGIDMQVYSSSNALKYDFVVAPYARISQIVMEYEGPDAVRLEDGDLVIKTSVGRIVEASPYAYQLIGGDTVHVEARYALSEQKVRQGKGKAVVRMDIGSYDRSKPLIIDPQLYFSTYTGSTADNWGTTATYDSYKNTYTGGIVFDIGYPTSVGAYDTMYHGNVDVAIFKFDTTGGERIYATYLGGAYADMPHSMFVNSFDELVVFGTTGSADFPVSDSAFMTTFIGGSELSYLDYYYTHPDASYNHHMWYPSGSDIFVSRFSSDGTELKASTLVGGSGNDGLNFRNRYNDSYTIMMQGNDSLYFNYGDGVRGELITDDMNNVYVGTTTMSTNFPVTSGALQGTRFGEQDGVVFKLDYNMQNMLWSTYLGGGGDDAVYSIDVDSSYNVIVCGGTTSNNFPTTEGAYQTTYGGGSTDGFISKISYNGDELMHSTYFGSNKYDQCFFVRTGKRDEVFIFGQTKATGYTMIYNAGYNVPGSGMLLARLTPDLSRRIWSTVFGTPLGRPNLSPTAFAADICNRVYAAGWGRDFVGYNGVQWYSAGTYGMEVTTNAFQTQTDGQDFYIISMDEDAQVMDYATFFGEYHASDADRGADHVDGGTSRFDKLSTIYQSVCGSCGHTQNFPVTPGAWSSTNNSSNCNNAIFRMNIHTDYPVAEFIPPPAICWPQTCEVQNTGRGTSFKWDFGDGTTPVVTNSTTPNIIHQYAHPGTYIITLVAYQEGGCRGTDTARHEVSVLQNGSRIMDTTWSCTHVPVHIGVRPRLGCEYTWLTGNVSDIHVANPYVTETGTYILKIDGGVCVELDTFRVIYVDLLDTVLTVDPNCPGGNDGSANAVLDANAVQPIRYTWDNSTTTSSTIENLTAGMHTLIVSDAHCLATTRFRISDPPVMVIHKESKNELCNDSCKGWIHVWCETGDTLLQNLCPGTYTVTMNDSHNCPYHDTTTVIRVQSFENMHVWADDSTIFRTESTHLHVTPVYGSNYVWEPSEWLNNPHIDSPKATPDDTTTFTVTVIDSAGCTWTDSVTINCIDVNCGRPNVFIPNAFTPNEDGRNDRLCITGEYIVEFYIAVFTRWGELVYESHDINECWDGRYKGNYCLPGVYAYLCRITCEAGFKGEFKGDITIIR